MRDLKKMQFNDYIIEDVGFDDILIVKHPNFENKNDEYELIEYQIGYPTKSVLNHSWFFEIGKFPKNENEEPKYEKWNLSDENKELFKDFIRNVFKPAFFYEPSKKVLEKMSMIDNKLNRVAEKEMQLAAKNSVTIENYMNTIHEWKSRIDDLIDLANYAKKNKIPLCVNDLTNQCYERGFFYSNGWSHLVGFINEDNISKLGIIAGGAFGKWNFYTDGEFLYESDDDGNKQEPQLQHLEKFVKNFPIFEEEFYKYIDRYCKDE